MQAEKKNKFYIPELDGLRFFAFLLVFISHAPYFEGFAIFKTLREFGWIGVDLFLCLSSFLITKLLIIENKEIGSIHILNFYKRRILKIFPLYFLIILFLIIYNLQIHNWNFVTQQRIIGMMFFSDNLFAAFVGYNHLFSAVHLWTISYEEQFYFFIPFLIRKITTIENRIKLILMIFALVLLGLIRSIFIYNNVSHPAIWVLPITHFESILAGLALGLGLLDGIFKRVGSYYLLFFGFLSIYIIFKLPNTDVTGWSLMFTYPLIAIGMVIIVYIVIQGNISIIQMVLKNKAIVYFGKISYGLYVYHLLCLATANYICNQLDITSRNFFLYPLAMVTIGMTLAIVLATISYNIYEKPFLILKNRFTEVRSRPL